MKKIVLNILSLVFSLCMYAQDVTPSDLIGEWIFCHLQDMDGNKHSELKTNYGGKEYVEKINRSSYLFKDNGEYVSANPLDISVGKWTYDEKTNTLYLKLQIFEYNKYWDSLKRIVKQDSDGNYYQKPHSERILYLSKDSMVIEDRPGYVLIYKNSEYGYCKK